jgi:anti-anti-sigma factor
MLDAVKTREYEKAVIVDVGEQVIKEEKYALFNDILLAVLDKDKDVGINLKALSYINSRMISILLLAAKEIHRRSRELYLIGASDKVEALLYVNGLDRIVFIVENEDNLTA